jgi:hypothetical protein
MLAIYHIVEDLDANNVTKFANSSNIKFGSWDQQAMVSYGELRMFRCQDLNAWRVAGRNFYIGVNHFIRGQVRYLEINPNLPYLYIPDEDFISFQSLMVKMYPDIICSFKLNVCYWDKSCSEVKTKSNPFRIEIFDKIGSMHISIEEYDLKMSGSRFGASDKHCYVPVFRSGSPSKVNW